MYQTRIWEAITISVHDAIRGIDRIDLTTARPSQRNGALGLTGMWRAGSNPRFHQTQPAAVLVVWETHV